MKMHLKPNCHSTSYLKQRCHLCIMLLCISASQKPAIAFNFQSNQPNFIESPNVSSNFANYFGYKIAIQPDLFESRLLAGSPKSRQATDGEVGFSQSLKEEAMEKSGSGDLHSCSIDFDANVQICISARPPPLNKTANPYEVTDRESLGLSLTNTRDTGNTTICAPIRMKNCPSRFWTYGVCHSSFDFGQTWSPQLRGVTAECVGYLDMIFVLDGSGSVTRNDPENFDRVKDWVKRVTADFELRNFAKVGVIQYSHYFENRDLTDQTYIKTEIPLGQYDDLVDFEQAVDRINHQGFTTYTAHAINKTVLDFMNSTRYNNPFTRKVMVLLTDGSSSDRSFLEASSSYARSLGITIFAIGVANYSESELQTITGTTDQSENNGLIFEITDFSDLGQIVGSLQQSIVGFLEGGSSYNSTNELQQAQAGMDAIGTVVSRMSVNNVCLYLVRQMYCALLSSMLYCHVLFL